MRDLNLNMPIVIEYRDLSSIMLILKNFFQNDIYHFKFSGCQHLFNLLFNQNFIAIGLMILECFFFCACKVSNFYWIRFENYQLEFFHSE